MENSFKDKNRNVFIILISYWEYKWVETLLLNPFELDSFLQQLTFTTVSSSLKSIWIRCEEGNALFIWNIGSDLYTDASGKK